MALPIADDLAAILNVEEFATAVTYGGATIYGIFDNETVPVDAGGYAQVHQEQPRLTCRTTDISGVTESDQVVISGTTYDVKAWIHDGTGVSVLQLEKV